MKVANNFYIFELIPDYLYKSLGDNSIRFIDNRIIYSLQSIREYFDSPITVNNKFNGGEFNYRGFRPQIDLVKKFVKSNNLKPYVFGSPTSQHAFGRAADFHIDEFDINELRDTIIKHRDNKFPFITAIEMKVNWIHIDVRFSISNELLKFNP